MSGARHLLPLARMTDSCSSPRTNPSSGSTPNEAPRVLKHTRALRVDVYHREDGLWDVEARLSDVKTKDIKLAEEVRVMGDPIHDMTVCLTINEQFDVLAAKANSNRVPYPGYCEAITPAYGQLVGLNLLKNFNREVRARLSKTSGCTHITELTAVMPTAAVQAFSGEVNRPQALSKPDVPPFYIDSCHALVRSGAAVKTYYPKWYRLPAPVATDIDSQSSTN
jgi:Protein of unknown function (DUF2889)